MSSASARDEGPIEVVPFIIFALVLLVPFLDFRLTFYRSTLKLFAFQTATVVLWCYLLWQWGTGRLRGGDWPAHWLFAPLALWVAWGLVTMLWSPRSWLAGRWVVQGASGLAGALGLALLLRERRLREQFAAAAGAVAAAVAVLMFVAYGDPMSGFFGEIGTTAREVGAAFLLVPTLVAGALLYGRPGKEAAESDRAYLRVIGLAALLLVLLAAGVRADSAGWTYGVGAGAVVVVWLLLPRWRALAPVLLLVVVVLCVGREARLRERAAEPPWREHTREALLDRTGWALVGESGFGRLVAGHGVGNMLVAFEEGRPRETYATPLGDKFESHARRHLTDLLYERGLVGLLLAVAAGAACVAAGVLAFRRARDDADACLGAGLAAGVVALGLYGCLASGSVSFGAGMAFWVAVGLLGGLTVETGRAAALAWSEEEDIGRLERGSRLRMHRLAIAFVGGGVLVAAWCTLAARLFWPGFALREGRAELTYTRAYAQERDKARGALDAVRRTRGQSPKEFEEAKKAAEETHEKAIQVHQDSVSRAAAYLRRAARLSLDGRVWLNAQLSLALCDASRGDYTAAAQRYDRLREACGPLFDLDLLRAACYAELRQPAKAHQHFRDYARKNPLAAPCALFVTKTNLYEPWLLLIDTERRKPDPDPRWRQWAWDFIDACDAGLAVYPEHYALLMHSGEMHYRLGRDEEAYDLMTGAANILHFRLRVRRYAPLLTARLVLELAYTYTHWDKPMALTVLDQIGAISLDFTDPEARLLREKAGLLMLELDPGRARQARAEAARRARGEEPQPRTPTPPARAPATPTRP